MIGVIRARYTPVGTTVVRISKAFAEAGDQEDDAVVEPVMLIETFMKSIVGTEVEAEKKQQ